MFIFQITEILLIVNNGSTNKKMIIHTDIKVHTFVKAYATYVTRRNTKTIRGMVE